MGGITQIDLDGLSSLESEVCKATLDRLGGFENVMTMLGTNTTVGLTKAKVLEMREAFGMNQFPESPMESYLHMLLSALNDTTLIVLMIAASVSLGVGIYEEGPEHGWIEGGAIFIAVALVANIGAMNDYSKQKQFAALEKTSAEDEKCTVLRDGQKEVINPRDCVVGDIIVLWQGEQIPTDCIIAEPGKLVMSSQASLTGEPEDLKKTQKKDFTLYSSCLITEADDNFYAVATGIGVNSQWGKIKATLATEARDTPLQEKLATMTGQIGYIGMFFSILTFIALIISIWARDNGEDVAGGFIRAFILAVTIVVVAIPEGLPLAVTIALAYSTKEMYKDQCLIRVLAACETMGNATNICSDKTGTLTENRMTVVTGFFSGEFYEENLCLDASKVKFEKLGEKLSPKMKTTISDHTSINRTAMLVYNDKNGNPLPAPMVVGNKTEGALMLMAKSWGIDYDAVFKEKFNASVDKVFAFNSAKKRSTTVVHQPDGSVRLFVKGASEWVIRDCTKYSDANGNAIAIDDKKRKELLDLIDNMANRALRTLVLSHIDFPSKSAMPANWEDSPPDNANLICDCIVGIIDPLRGDVRDAVATAQGAGVYVRMVTGDNIATATAIAKQCGIKTEHGIAVEGPTFRKMTPKEADIALKKLQVMARSSPDDKHLLVTRLNGGAIPENQAAWEKLFEKYSEYKWETHKDILLPGYKEEWTATRPEGGQVVGVTGDGTNDAPALKAADVGLAMGITGTKVAQSAADIVILDDRFSSIVRAIMWGRSVFDNIRKFLQFQLTVNVVALALVFIGAAAGFGQPLTAVQMLWVNLVMDTMGALALGTEAPTLQLLKRRPYKRSASLISKPMMRNIACQSIYQLILLLVLLFKGAGWFHVRDMSTHPCFEYKMTEDTTSKFAVAGADRTCSELFAPCANTPNSDCYYMPQFIGSDVVLLSEISGFKKSCLQCVDEDFTHGTIIFNSFIWCQISNEYTSRVILNDLNHFKGIFNNFMFLYVSIFTFTFQTLIVYFGGSFTSTSGLTIEDYFITLGLGVCSMFVGVAQRFIPIHDDPNSFFAIDDAEEEQHVEKGIEMKPV